MHLHVTCAIIENNGTVLVARRSTAMSMPLKWEFPGGKIHENETPEECLKRELMEELGVTVVISGSLAPSTYAYSAFTITLYPFICKIVEGDVVLHEHACVKWVEPGELQAVDWTEADVPVAQEYLRYVAALRAATGT